MLRSLVVLVLGVSLLVASSARAERPRAQEVEVLWGGSYWAAEVLGKRCDFVKVHYVGWGSEWDEWVEPERVRRRPPRQAVGAARAGQRLEAEWQGSWWEVTVIAKRNGLTKVHYVGWGPEWDEWVGPGRLRHAE